MLELDGPRATVERWTYDGRALIVAMPSGYMALAVLLRGFVLAATVAPFAFSGAGCASFFNWFEQCGSYGEEKLGPDVYRVSCGSTPREWFALLAAAELTVAEGGRYFVILRREMASSPGVPVLQQSPTPGGPAQWVGGFSTWEIAYTIKVLPDPPPTEEHFVYDARFVRQALLRELGLDPSPEDGSPGGRGQEPPARRDAMTERVR